MKDFGLSESKWLNSVGKLAPIGSSKIAWVRIESEEVWKLPAMPCQILVDERMLYFRLSPTAPQDLPEIELQFYLPDEGATFDERLREGESRRFSMECLVKWQQNRHSQAFRLIIATEKEFLVLVEGEQHVN